MPRFLIHLGPHKTGSSHIQRCLHDNSEQLERAGVAVAGMWNESAANPSHVGLVKRLNSESRGEIEPIFDGWRTSSLQTVVISCEDLAGLSLEPVKIQMLSQLTAQSPVTLVYYVRR